MSEFLNRFFFEEHVGEPIFATQADSGMVDCAIGIDQFSSDYSGAGEREPSGHVFEPTRSQCFDIVIEMEQEWRVSFSTAEIDEARIVKSLRRLGGVDDATPQIGSGLYRGQIIDCFRIGRMVVNHDHPHGFLGRGFRN